jgi:hypothetical protein
MKINLTGDKVPVKSMTLIKFIDSHLYDIKNLICKCKGPGSEGICACEQVGQHERDIGKL